MKPYISTHENEDGNTVLLYIDEVCIDEDNKPQYIVINKHHLKDIIEELKDMERYYGNL